MNKKAITYMWLDCPKCGETDIDIFANYCPNCGTSLKGVAVSHKTTSARRLKALANRRLRLRCGSLDEAEK